MPKDSALRLYNTRTKREEDFVPLKKGTVRMYSCGPTVYGRPHVGNYSSFLLADLLRRWLEVSGYTVTHVKNITDVGHLVADADDGEDKIEKQARQEFGSVTHESVIGIARKYEAQYLEDEKVLNFREPEHRPRATETIPEMIEMIEELMKKGHAYETDDGVYFAVETFPGYGELSGNTLDKLQSGSRIAVDEKKKHPADFALWKKCVGINKNHALRWDSPWGPGFPGWHIECSCMSAKFLGEQFDIHTGGEDLIFPHHECEIAQSEGSGSPHPHVNMWVHKRFIDLGDEKMSKSTGNVLGIPDILAMGYSPLDLRYYLLSVHYRTNLKFTEKGLEDAHKARRSIVEWLGEDLSGSGEKGSASDVQKFIDVFSDAMNSDLNTPSALAAIFECMTWSRTHTLDAKAQSALKEFQEMIRNTFGCFESQEEAIPADVLALVDQRAAARAAKNFAESDRLRDEIKTLGYEVRDAGAEQIVKKL